MTTTTTSTMTATTRNQFQQSNPNIIRTTRSTTTITTTRMTTTTTISDGKFYNLTNTIFSISATPKLNSYHTPCEQEALVKNSALISLEMLSALLLYHQMEIV